MANLADDTYFLNLSISESSDQRENISDWDQKYQWQKVLVDQFLSILDCLYYGKASGREELLLCSFSGRCGVHSCEQKSLQTAAHIVFFVNQFVFVYVFVFVFALVFVFVFVFVFLSQWTHQSMSAPSLTTTLVTAFLLLLWLILAALPILFCCSPCEFVKLTEAAKKIVFA